MSPFVPEKKNLAHIPRHTSTRERASWNSIRYSNPGQTSLPEISIVSKISIELRRQRKPPPLLHRYNIGGRGEARRGEARLEMENGREGKKKREGRGKFAGAHNQRMKPVNFQFLHFLSHTRFVQGIIHLCVRRLDHPIPRLSKHRASLSSISSSN